MSTYVINTMWVLLASILVFLMHAGFAMVEVGFTQSKNAVNIIMKNFTTVSIGVICYFLIGFGLMYGEDTLGFVGTNYFMLMDTPDEVAGISFYAFFLFQAIFAATCATIVSGAVAERTKFTSYMLFCIVATTLIYPLIGHWIWGGGFLSNLGFRDFAGGTAVHGVGGICALIGAKMVGPRQGKYKNGKVKAIPGHNIPLGALGVLILWFGWFGFNPGSTLDITSSETIHAAITTLLSGAAATLATLCFSILRYKLPDAALTLNGALAGLVGITAGANMVSFGASIAIGIISALLMVVSVELLDRKFHIDDPVGAISVHGVCGSFGTIAIGLFAKDGGLLLGFGPGLLLTQGIGTLIALASAGFLAWLTFSIIKKTIGLRVAGDTEADGLDAIEHGISAYLNL
ncbi:ammonium transporter [Vallitalea okinawensis]|uniref:ammonium transporter n=1 Tax=Vallitalea okinawensis TaxID=2078660 RepID=UPI000CFDF5CE|nr:ammonium transporter [Vallitalea okinawensis]